ncbi:MAG: serine/threonine-protein phosphatase [Acidobacteria bacterium]|nr:serine/threonine-protein phosphatase [Acidobacteriota bacterium]
MMEGASFEEAVVPFGPGDLLLIHSDGVTEAVNAADEEFGEAALVALVRENRGLSAAELVERIIAAVQLHARGVQQADDVTLLVIQRAANTAAA